MTATTNRVSAIRWIEPPKLYDKITETKSKQPTKRVYICSPLKGRIETNIKRAQKYCRFAYNEGYVPIAPHLYFPQFLDDDEKDERAAGLRYGMEAMWTYVELWCFGKHITTGMKAEIELAMDLGIPVRYFNESMEERA
jgi:hypothetical protein